MKLLFVSANETLDGGLLQSQMILPIQKYLNDQASIVNLHRPFSNRFCSGLVKVHNLPVLVPFRYVNFRAFFPLNELLCVFYAAAILFSIRRNLFSVTLVCRGYVPGLVGWWLNRLFRVQYIFDPRSLYVHEHIGCGNIQEGSLVKAYWLWVERRVVRRAVRVVCVSRGMVTYYESLKVSLIAPLVEIPCFATAPDQLNEGERARIRRQLGYDDGDVLIAYFGSLNFGWNNRNIYIEFFKVAGAAGAKVIIISQDAPELKKSELNDLSFVQIIGGPNTHPREAASLLQAADYGVVLMDEVPDWKTRLSVKFAEYTCAGLPVIVGNFVGEAVRLVRTYQLAPSVIVDRRAMYCPMHKATFLEREHIRSWASEYFSNRKILDIFGDG